MALADLCPPFGRAGADKAGRVCDDMSVMVIVVPGIPSQKLKGVI